MAASWHVGEPSVSARRGHSPAWLEADTPTEALRASCMILQEVLLDDWRSTMSKSSKSRVSAASGLRRVSILLLWLIGTLAMAQPAPGSNYGSGRVQIKNVDPTGLLSAIADAANVNLVAGMPPDLRKVSLSANFTSINELFGRVADVVDMKIIVLGRRIGAIAVLYPRCDQREVQSSHPPTPGPHSLYFQEASLDRLLELINLKVSLSRDEIDGLRRRVAIRVKGASQEDITRALSVALGFNLSELSDGSGKIRFLNTPECPGADVQPTSRRGDSNRAPGANERGCQIVDRDARVCNPLEQFETEALVPRGYVDWNGRRAAFVEAPDGQLYALRPGDLLGRNSGKVLSVLPDAVEVEEIVQDGDGVWREKHVYLRY